MSSPHDLSPPMALRHCWPAALLLLLVALAGCHAPYDLVAPELEAPVPPCLIIPKEKSMVSLPAYRIEPPDILQIEMLKLVPLPPYRADVFDVLQIRATPQVPDQPPIDNYYIVEAEGMVNFGPVYGSVRVVGRTIDEIREAIRLKLAEILQNPEVSVQLSRVAAAQPVTGQYLVGPDGTINLRQYGMVHVAGKTVTEAREAVRKHLAQFLDSPDLSVEVLAYQSKYYYVITEGAANGDHLRRVPITGNETVLDAVSTVEGFSPVSSKRIWIARPAPGGFGCEQILPVDWSAVTRGGDTATNYQVMPGDRVFIAQDTLVTTTNMIAKIIGPFERIGGILSLGSSTIRGYQTMGRQYNRTRSGF